MTWLNSFANSTWVFGRLKIYEFRHVSIASGNFNAFLQFGGIGQVIFTLSWSNILWVFLVYFHQNLPHRLASILEIFSKDIQADVEKVLKNTLSNQPQMENTFVIDLTKQPPWKTFDELQYKLHQLSMYPEQVHSSDDVNNICTEIRKCISEHVLPDPMYKTIGIMTVHLVLLLSKWFRFLSLLLPFTHSPVSKGRWEKDGAKT